MLSCLCRITTYNESTRPIIDHYNKLGLVRTIDASSSVEQVCIDKIVL